MAAPVSIELLGLSELKVKLTTLERKVFPVAASRAINRTAVTVRRLAVKDIAKESGLPGKAIRSRVKITKRAGRIAGTSETALTAIVEGKGRPFNLLRFKARQLKKGVSANPWGRRQLFKGAFLVPSKAGSDTMFVAHRKSASKGSRKLEGMFGPGIARTMASEAITRAREGVVKDLLPKRLRSELDFRVKRLAARK